MSAFCVFGMTEPLAKAMAAKKASPGTMLNATDADVAAWRAREVERILTKGRSRQVSSPFSAPQFCQDWIDLANRTTRAARLKVMVRDTKVDKTGAVVLNKKTKRPVMAWRAWE